MTGQSKERSNIWKAELLLIALYYLIPATVACYSKIGFQICPGASIFDCKYCLRTSQFCKILSRKMIKCTTYPDLLPAFQ